MIDSDAAKNVTVFLGPSLPLARAQALLHARYLPPAQSGDVYRAVSSGSTLIILIDGVFHSTPSVWQREILNAMEDGVTVMGAASMGALRAAELHSLGMIGVGQVFEWYRGGVLDADDAVAVQHSTAEHHYRSISVPLVNIRATLDAALEEGLLSPEVAAQLLQCAERTYYPERSYPQLLKSAESLKLDPQVMAIVRDVLCNKIIDQKSLDAEEALVLGAELLLRPRASSAVHGQGSIWDGARLWFAHIGGNGTQVAGHDLFMPLLQQPHLWAWAFGLEPAIALQTMRQRLAMGFFARNWAADPGDADLSFGPEPALKTSAAPTARQLQANGLNGIQYQRLQAQHTHACNVLRHRMGLDTTARNAASVEPHPEDCHEIFGELAQEHGVLAGNGLTSKQMGELMLAQGPEHFGYRWEFVQALLAELQRTLNAAAVADRLAMQRGA